MIKLSDWCQPHQTITYFLSRYFIQSDLNKYICQKMVKQYMFIEPSSKH